MPLRRRRPIARAAVVGGTAYVAGKAGAAKGAEAAAQQQAAAPPPPQQAEAPIDAPVEESTEDKMEQLKKLKGLLDEGILTQDEFDAQKAKILASM